MANDHLDNLNDIVLAEDTMESAQVALKHYCNDNDLDPEGFSLVQEFEDGETYRMVYISE